MKPAVYDLTIYCGTTHDAANLTFTYKSGGVPVDLTGVSARSQCRGSKGLIFDASTENGQIVISELNGSISFNFSADQTSKMWREGMQLHQSDNCGAVYLAGNWDMELYHGDGRVERLICGKVFLSKEITL